MLAVEVKLDMSPDLGALLQNPSRIWELPSEMALT